jgi:hypothetical protein
LFLPHFLAFAVFIVPLSGNRCGIINYIENFFSSVPFHWGDAFKLLSKLTLDGSFFIADVLISGVSVINRSEQ